MNWTQAILARKKLIIRLIWVVYIAAFVFFVYSVRSPNFQAYWIPMGRAAGDTAAVLFCLAVLPGILKRLGATGGWQQVQVMLMAFRRQLGIGVYWFGVLHSSWVSNLDKIMAGLPPLPVNAQESLGTISLFLLLPLFLTSNDWMQNKLGTWWYRLHKLVYLVAWLIFAHVALLNRFEWVGVLILMTATLTVWSFMVKEKREKFSTQSPERA